MLQTMRYVFSRMYDPDQGVVTSTLRGGSQEGEHPRAVLRVTSFHPPCVFSPDGCLVVTSDLMQKIKAARPDLADCFRQYAKVLVYPQDPDAYPAKLDDLVIRDDFDLRLWRKLPCRKFTSDQTLYEFYPRVITHPEASVREDFKSSEISYAVKADGMIGTETKRIRWSPSLVAEFPCCWVDGGYVLDATVHEILKPYLGYDQWETATLA